MTPYPRTRFAPGPTGRLHLGHAYSAHFAWAAGGGQLILRMEDIDQERCRPQYESGIIDDLAWLGLWDNGEFHRQTEARPSHLAALDCLRRQGLLYPCFCTRREIAAEAARSASAPHGPDGPVYAGTCRRLPKDESKARVDAGEQCVWRLDVEGSASRHPGLTWRDRAQGNQAAKPFIFGDVVLVRRFDMLAYHLCCVVDDAAQNIQLVTRGWDLFAATHVHRLLQALLNLPTPEYHHHGLVVDERGRRLAKRTDALSIDALRNRGLSPSDVIQLAAQSVAPDTALELL